MIAKILGGFTAIVITLLLLTLLYGLIFKFEGKQPTYLGLVDGTLLPPPQSPNGVSSNADPQDTQHYIKGILYAQSPYKTPTKAIEKIKLILQELPNNFLVMDEKHNPHYLYAQFTSKALGFVDDVEFYADETGYIQVRSASRIGRSDLGVNRKRIEEIRKRFNEQ